MKTDIIKIFKCLADNSRLQILKSLAKEDMYVERLAERLNLSAPTISFHLKKLEEIGAVSSRKEQYYVVYTLCRDTLSFNILDAVLTDLPGDLDQDERDNIYKQKVLSAFMPHGKLKTIPAQLKKKSIVLEEIYKAFEAGKQYTEKEVNIIIADYHDDFCTIRRHMIDFGLLCRKDRIYYVNDAEQKLPIKLL